MDNIKQEFSLDKIVNLRMGLKILKEDMLNKTLNKNRQIPHREQMTLSLLSGLTLGLGMAFTGFFLPIFFMAA